ncbi:MAG: hypothetical protein IJW70_08185, partial [Clostridia bacterium]|nr:hypothetical protein [Clostridia bacterium]
NGVKKVSPLRRRRGLRALDPREPLKRLDPNFHPVVIRLSGSGRKLSICFSVWAKGNRRR